MSVSLNGFLGSRVSMVNRALGRINASVRVRAGLTVMVSVVSMAPTDRQLSP